MKRQVLKIPVDGPVRSQKVEDYAYLDTLQAIVGGLIEPVDLPELGGLTIYVNEEGLLTNEPEMNRRATDLAMAGGMMLMGPLFGDAVVVGPLLSDGNTDTLSDEKVIQIMGLLQGAQ